MNKGSLRLIAVLCICTFTQCVPLSEFYPFGSGTTDVAVPYGDDGNSGKIVLGYQLPYLGSFYDSLYVNINGVVTFESGFSTYVPTPFPLAIPILALFWADAITSSSNGGAVYYKSTTSTQLLSKASQNVGRLGNTNNFQATSLFLATWDRLSFFGASSSSDFSLRNTFQLALASNGKESYAIYLYNRLEWFRGTSGGGQGFARAGFSGGSSGSRIYFTIRGSGSRDILNLVRMSNVGVPGMWIFSITGQFNYSIYGFPLITGNPILGHRVIHGRGTELVCKFALIYSRRLNDTRFNVTWLAVDRAGRGKPFYHDIIKGTNSSEIVSHLGSTCQNGSNACYSGKQSFKFRCAVRSYFKNSVSMKSPLKTSNDYFIGIKISPEIVQLYSLDNTARFKITRTLPVMYLDAKCRPLVITIITSSEIATKTSCNVQFNESLALNETQTVEFRQRVSSRPQIKEYHIEFLVHAAKCHADYSNMAKMQGLVPLLPKVKIKFLGNQHQHRQGQCRVTSDPRVYTFDGSYFLMYDVGYYVLARSRERQFEIHIRFKECGSPGSLSCTCGFAVWEKTEVVIVDYCKTDSSRPNQAPRLEAKIYSASKHNSGTKIIKKPGKPNAVTAIMPSGAQVEADLLSAGNPNFQQFWSLDVYVRVFEGNKGRMDGLCGNFDDDSSNDIQNSQTGAIYSGDLRAKYYRLAKEKSIFRKYRTILQNACHRNETLYNETLYCKCTEVPNGENFNRLGECSKKVAATVAESSLPGSFRQSCVDDDKSTGSKGDWYNPDDSDIADNKTRNITVLQWPTPSGIDEIRARDICSNKLRQTTLWDACITMRGVNFSTTTETCVSDIKNLDDPRAAVRTAIEDIQQTCHFAVNTNVSLWIRNSTNGTQEFVIPVAILDKMCPNQCSFRGNCTNGTCTCIAKFTGSDCSSEVDKIPRLTGIAGSSLCDVRNKSCNALTVIGEDFADTSQLTCMGWKDSVQDSQLTAQIVLLTSQQAICSLPIRGSDQYSEHSRGSSSYPMHISISNDGRNFSNHIRYHVYDSLCQSCRTFNSCRQIERTCSINGYCFADGNSNPFNWCLICNSTESTNKWTQRRDNTRPELKLNVSNEYVVSEGGNVFILVHASDPEGRSVDVSYSIEGSVFTRLSGSLLKIGPVFYRINLIIKALDPCGLEAVSAVVIENIPGHLTLEPRAERDRGIDLVCQIIIRTSKVNQTKFCVTWYTVDAAGIGEPFHNEIVQEDNNGTIISRLKSACNQSSNVNGCYTGKKSLKVSPEVVHLYRPDAIARFEITRTLPVIYLGTKCTPLAVTVVTTKDIATKTACTVEFNKSLTVNETQTFELRRRVSSRPQIAVYDIEFLVHTTKCHASWSDLAKRQQLISLFPKVKVVFSGNQQQNRQGQCRVTNDPRIITFDRSYYVMYGVGYYVLARSRYKDFEVHIRFKECGSQGSWSCTCGFAVREETEIVIVDYCKNNANNPSQAPVLESRIYSASKSKSATKIIKTPRNPSSVTAIMPSGSQVQAYLRSAGNPNLGKFWSLDVYVRVFEENNGALEGLCGNFDGDSSNDIQDAQFGSVSSGDAAASQFRLAKVNSIFRNYRMILSRLCYNNETLYCQCTNVPHEEGVYQAGECNNRISLTVPESGLPGSFSSACFNDNMSTGSTVDWYEPDDGDVKEKQRNITALLWPTPSGINENGARNFCIGRLRQTTFWNVCGQITGVNLSRTIDTCVGDIKNLDDPDAAVKTAIEDVQQICKFAIDTNASIWIEKTSNGSHKLVRPNTLLGKMCPNQCSFRGNCTNGTCTCLPEFTGSDCSFVVGKIPQLTYLVGPLLCNIRNKSCGAVTIIGKNFADTSELTCKGSKNNVDSSLGMIQIVLVSNEQVLCSLPIRGFDQYSESIKGSSSYPFHISISNNGRNFSNHLLYHVYDSICQSCRSFNNCQLVDNTCSINGYCFTHGSSHPVNWCLVCNSTESTDMWTKRKDNKIPYLKLNVTEEYVVSSGDNVTVFVQASDPEGKAVNVSYSVDGSIFYKLSSNLVIIGPVYDRKELRIKARDYCGLETTATAVIVTNSPYWTSTFCLDDKFGIKIKSNISFFVSVTLKDPSCIAASNGAEIILSTQFSECGSTKTETRDHIVVSNAVKLMRATKGTITRYNEMVIPFTCSYSRSRWTSITSFRPEFKSFIKAQESGFGNFTLSFRMARGASFDSYYSSYPVTVETNERVYFQLSMASNATDAALLIEKCFATPSKNRNDLVRYTLIENRCPKDTTLQFHPGEFHHKMFSILAFKFVSNTSTIYLHCEVFICDQASEDQRCRSGCSINRISSMQKRNIKKSTSVPEPSRNFVLDNGPIQKALNKNAGVSSKSVSTTTAVMAIVVGVLVLLVVGILSAKMIKSRRGKSLTENNTAAEKQGKDNEALEMQCDIH